MMLFVSFLLSHSLVISLHLKHMVLFLHGGLVFEHSSHAGDGVSLVGVGLFFGLVSVRLLAVLTLLLFNPLFLGSLVGGHTGIVRKIFSFKLTDARDMHGYILGGSVESLSGTFH